jgi:hypothetical protein
MSLSEVLRDPVMRRRIWEYLARADALIRELSAYVSTASLRLPQDLAFHDEAPLAMDMAAGAVVSEGARVPKGSAARFGPSC